MDHTDVKSSGIATVELKVSIRLTDSTRTIEPDREIPINAS